MLRRSQGMTAAFRMIPNEYAARGGAGAPQEVSQWGGIQGRETPSRARMRETLPGAVTSGRRRAGEIVHKPVARRVSGLENGPTTSELPERSKALK